MMNRAVIFIFFALAAMTPSLLVAQLSVRPIGQSSHFQKTNSRISAVGRDSTQLELPFWDDFSKSSYLPDSLHWFVEDGTSNVSPSVGIDPPTVNVAVFDGWNGMGLPYSSLQLQEGGGDSLVSRFIDLTKVNPSLWETVYISFFWQKEGRGEEPDDEDSIRLQVMNSEKMWRTVWRKSGNEVNVNDAFEQEIVQLKDPSYFHDYFQFRFQSFGRLSGGFDTWNIDYIYMNYNRTPDDIYVEDRALTTKPSSWMTQYAALPYDHFIVNIEQNIKPTEVGISNLDQQVQAIEYYALIQDSTRIFDEMNQGTPRNLAPASIASVTSESIDPNAFDPDADSISLLLETKFFITSGDSANWLDKYDLRSNDTTRSFVLLGDELAYDDGSAEWGAGLSQRSALLAYRYVIPKSDAITSLNIYFPEFVPSSAGKSFTIIIWDDLLPDRQGRLLTEQHIVQRSTRLNEFTSYSLGRPVVVSDTFYIGYEQSVSDFFPIGLDKYGQTQEGNIFINLDGVWEPSNAIEGNLMLRPVFGFKEAVGFEEEIFKDILVYPNPNIGLFSIKGEFEEASIMDLLGNRIATVKGGKLETEINIKNQRKGIYLIRILKDSHYKTYKIILK